MEDFSKFIPFLVKGITVNIVSFDTAYGANTVAEIDNKHYYLGHAEPDITAAISAWQHMSGQRLSIEEIDEVIRENSVSDIDEQ